MVGIFGGGLHYTPYEIMDIGLIMKRHYPGWGLTDSTGNPLEDEERTWPSWFNIDELKKVT